VGEKEKKYSSNSIRVDPIQIKQNKSMKLFFKKIQTSSEARKLPAGQHHQYSGLFWHPNEEEKFLKVKLTEKSMFSRETFLPLSLSLSLCLCLTFPQSSGA
jgi:hypothetical protein